MTCLDCPAEITRGGNGRRLRCAPCAAARRTLQIAAHHKRRIARGICNDCQNPTVPGSARCAACAEDNRVAQRDGAPRFNHCSRCGSHEHILPRREVVA